MSIVFLKSDKTYFKSTGITRKKEEILVLYMLYLKHVLCLQVEILKSQPDITVWNLC